MSPTAAIRITSFEFSTSSPQRRIDRGRPVGNLVRAHLTLGLEPGVAISPTEHVLEVLRARENRAAAELLVHDRFRSLVRQTTQKLVQHPRRHFVSLTRVHKSEENEMG